MLNAAKLGHSADPVSAVTKKAKRCWALSSEHPIDRDPRFNRSFVIQKQNELKNKTLGKAWTVLKHY